MRPSGRRSAGRVYSQPLNKVATDPLIVTDTRQPDWIALLPHRPPMRLVEQVVEVRPGESARCTRVARGEDWFFQGHFPDVPVVPAIVLVELLAQTGGLAAGSTQGSGEPLALRVAALGGFKFPRGAGAGVTLEATARVAGKMGGLYKIEGEVTADGALVASGSLTLAEARQR
jgi:3-hydroxyacyl-[acyl-carrier-protein] dehydratase